MPFESVRAHPPVQACVLVWVCVCGGGGGGVEGGQAVDVCAKMQIAATYYELRPGDFVLKSQR